MHVDVCHINFARGFRGGERQALILIKEFASLGLKQRLVCKAHQDLGRRCRGIENLDIVAESSLFGAVKACRQARLLHAHEGRGAYIAWAASILFGIPFIGTRRITRTPKKRPLTRMMYRHARVWIVLSHAVERSLKDYEQRLTTVHVPSAWAGSKPDRLRVQALRNAYDDRFLIVQIGAADYAIKGQDVLLNVAEQWQAKLPGVQFLFWGDQGDDIEKLKRACERLSNCVALGHTPGDIDTLAAADIMVQPSREEGLGSILLDAMAHGIPRVASRVGGIPDVIEHEQTGLLVPPGDVDALSAALLSLKNNKNERERLANNARQCISMYTPARVGEQTLGVYATIDERFNIERQTPHE